MLKIGVAVIVVAALLTGGFYLWSDRSDELPEFKTVAIDSGTVVATASATGTVEAIKLVQVGSQVSGTIQSLRVDFNTRVKKGDILCQLDPTTLQASVARDDASLKKAQAQVERAQANLTEAENEWKRAQTLVKSNSISESEWDQRVAAYEAGKADLKVARADVLQARAALALSTANLTYATIRSPVDGVVILRNVEVGQTVAASFQTPELFQIVEALDPVHVLASVGEADIGRVKAGQPVTFTVDAHPDDTFIGKVEQVRLEPEVEQNVVTYTVVLRADNPDGKLMLGMTANVEIEVDRTDEHALRIPNTALRFNPRMPWLVKDFTAPEQIEQGDRHWQLVWVREGKRLNAIAVKVGISDGNVTQILPDPQGKIAPGMRVVVGSVHRDEPDVVNPFSSRSRRSRNRK